MSSNGICNYHRPWLAVVRDLTMILGMVFICGLATHTAIIQNDRLLAALETVGLAQIYTQNIKEMAEKQEEIHDTFRKYLSTDEYKEFYKKRRKK